MSRVYWVVAFAVVIVVFSVVTDVFGLLYTLSVVPWWVQAVSCFPDARFCTDVVFAVWFGVLTVVTYVSLLALSECFTSSKERVWQEHGYE